MNLNRSSQPESQLPLRAEVRSEFHLSNCQLPLGIANFTKLFQKAFKLGAEKASEQRRFSYLPQVNRCQKEYSAVKCGDEAQNNNRQPHTEWHFDNFTKYLMVIIPFFIYVAGLIAVTC